MQTTNATLSVIPNAVRGLFCDGCGRSRSLIKCNDCHIGLCCGNDVMTGCLNPAEVVGRSWFCPKHNKNPVKLKYNINNVGRTGHLHCGRILVPLLHLIIVPGEVGLQKNQVNEDFITPHLRDWYQQYSQLLFTSTCFGPSGPSIHNFRDDVERWMSTHVNSAVLVTLMAHSIPSTGEIVYSHPGSKLNKYGSVDKVIAGCLGQTYSMAIQNNNGMKGLISTACGYTYNNLTSRKSWSDLVDQRHFHWILGFGADMVVGRNIAPYLHQFAEYAFLRDMDGHGNILGTSTNLLVDSVQTVFSGRDLLAQTSVLLIYRSSSGLTLLREYVHSTRCKPWGYPVPSCKTCGNATVVAPVRHGVARAKCLGCGWKVDGPGADRPAHVIEVNPRRFGAEDEDLFCWRTFGALSPFQMDQ